MIGLLAFAVGALAACSSDQPATATTATTSAAPTGGYIGTPRQQIGHGGFIAQVTDTLTGKVVAVTDAGCRCQAIHSAPLDPGCATSATIRWDPRAQLVWSSDLKLDNTLLCTLTVTRPTD
ncbi:MAG: hypothetical protein ACKO91_11060 [Acidimicrobiales bacterium]